MGNGGVIHSEQEQNVEKKEGSGCVCEEETLRVEEGSHVCAWRACFPKNTCCPGGILCALADRIELTSKGQGAVSLRQL